MDYHTLKFCTSTFPTPSGPNGLLGAWVCLIQPPAQAPMNALPSKIAFDLGT